MGYTYEEKRAILDKIGCIATVEEVSKWFDQSFKEFVATDNPFKQHIPKNTHIEKIRLDITRNELKLLLSERMKNDGSVNKPLNDLTDKCCKLFGFTDWLQAYHKL